MEEQDAYKVYENAHMRKGRPPISNQPLGTIILIVVFAIVVFWAFNTPKVEKNRNKTTIITTTLSPEEEAKRRSEAARREENMVIPTSRTTTVRTTEKPRNTRDELLENLKKEGFVLAKDPNKVCGREIKDYDCLSKGGLVAELNNGNLLVIEYDKNLKGITTEDILRLIGRIYNRNIYKTTIDGANNTFKNLSKISANSVSFVQDGLLIDVANYSKPRISVSYFLIPDNNLEIESVSSILLDEDNNYGKQFLTELFLSSNKHLIKYYDYFNLHIKDQMKDVCVIKLNNTNGYAATADYCHGGTSNISFDMEKNKLQYDIIGVKVYGDYFEKNFKTFLETDLKYIGDKLDANYKLTDEHISEIKKLITDSKESSKSIEIKLNDKFKITIRHEPEDYNKPYLINYLLD